MTKLLDADWLRGVQLFHAVNCSTINDFPKTNKMAERFFKHKCEIKLSLRNQMKIRTKAPKLALTKELNENTNKSTKFRLNVWQDWTLVREYDVDIEEYPCNIHSPRRLVQFWKNFQTSLVYY